METTIRLNPSELNLQFLEMVKLLIDKEGYEEISITMTHSRAARRLRKETPAAVQTKIVSALADLDAGEGKGMVSFSAEEFETFSKTLQ